MLEHFRRLLDYDTWANARMLDSVRTVAAPSEKLLALVAHVQGSKRMWLGRINADADATISTWPELSLDESDKLAQELLGRWKTYLDGLTEGDLSREVHYEIAGTGPGMQTVADIITHKFLHAMYHRAQIASLVRSEGGTPASTDLVVWTKSLRG